MGKQASYSLSDTEFTYAVWRMAMLRNLIQGPPHTYVVGMQTALGLPLLADQIMQKNLLFLLNKLQTTFACQLYAWQFTPSSYRLALRLRPPTVESDEALRLRWQALGGRTLIAADRLRERLGSLSGFMQTLNQRFSHLYHRDKGGRGQIWDGRFRCCLLADDAALIAAVSCMEEDEEASSDNDSVRLRVLLPLEDHPRLTDLPIRQLPGGILTPADEIRLGMPPSSPGEANDLLRQFIDEYQDSLPIYRQALEKGWALGRPESLHESLGRLGRSSGRGRSRQIRELDDDYGLCGLWG